MTFGANGGLARRDSLSGRKDDTFGIGFTFVQLSPSAIGFSTDAALYDPGVFTPKRSNETIFEATYQFQATPWAQVQPDLQYVHNPGAGLVNPVAPDRRIGGALVTGLRVNITF